LAERGVFLFEHVDLGLECPEPILNGKRFGGSRWGGERQKEHGKVKSGVVFHATKGASKQRHALNASAEPHPADCLPPNTA
jgi:hypothetical protein